MYVTPRDFLNRQSTECLPLIQHVITPRDLAKAAIHRRRIDHFPCHHVAQDLEVRILALGSSVEPFLGMYGVDVSSNPLLA
jgi:hypothetical protein